MSQNEIAPTTHTYGCLFLMSVFPVVGNGKIQLQLLFGLSFCFAMCTLHESMCDCCFFLLQYGSERECFFLFYVHSHLWIRIHSSYAIAIGMKCIQKQVFQSYTRHTISHAIHYYLESVTETWLYAKLAKESRTFTSKELESMNMQQQNIIGWANKQLALTKKMYVLLVLDVLSNNAKEYAPIYILT